MTFLLFLVSLAHMQSIVGVLAPLSIALFIVAGIIRGWLSSRLAGPLLLIIGFAIYLALMVFVQHSSANLALLAYVSGHAQIIYMLVVLLVMFVVRSGFDRLESSFYRGYLIAAMLVALSALYSVFVRRVDVRGIFFSNGRLPQGPFGGHDPLSGCLGAATLLTLALFLLPEGIAVVGSHRGWYRFCGAVVVVTFVVCKSRGYLLGAGVALAYLLITVLLRESRQRQLKPGLIVAWLLTPAGVGIVLTVLADRLTNLSTDQNVTTRYDLWSRAWDLFTQSPLVGIGLGSFEQTDLSVRPILGGLVSVRDQGYYAPTVAQHSTDGGLHAHEVFLQLLAETGVVGLLGVLSILIAAWTSARRITADPTTDDTARFSARLIQVMIVYLVVSGLTAGYTLLSPTTALVLYVAMARTFRRRWVPTVKASARVPSRRTASRASASPARAPAPVDVVPDPDQGDVAPGPSFGADRGTRQSGGGAISTRLDSARGSATGERDRTRFAVIDHGLMVVEATPSTARPEPRRPKPTGVRATRPKPLLSAPEQAMPHADRS